MKIELNKNEIGFLLQALDQLPVKGREVAKLIVSVSEKLEGALNAFANTEDNDE